MTNNPPSVPQTAHELRQHIDDIVDVELARLRRRLPQLDPEVRGELERSVRRAVDRLFDTSRPAHEWLAPEHADAVRVLFDLDAAIAPTLRAA